MNSVNIISTVVMIEPLYCSIASIHVYLQRQDNLKNCKLANSFIYPIHTPTPVKYVHYTIQYYCTAIMILLLTLVIHVVLHNCPSNGR